MQPKPPRHGLTAEYFSWSKPKETTRPVCPPPQSGKSVYFCGTNSFEGVAAQCAAGGAKRPPQGSTQRGNPSGRFFGDFLIGEKVTRGAGRSARIGGCRDCRPAKAPGAPSMARPCSRGAPALGSAEGAQPPRIVKQEPRGGAPASVGAGTAVPQKPAAKKVGNTKGRNRMVPPFCREWAGKPGSVMMTIYLDRRSPGGSSHIDRWLSPQKARRAAALLLRSRCCFG